MYLILPYDLHAQIDEEVEGVIEDEKDAQEGFFNKNLELGAGALYNLVSL